MRTADGQVEVRIFLELRERGHGSLFFPPTDTPHGAPVTSQMPL